jgi:hypothetical protein
MIAIGAWWDENQRGEKLRALADKDTAALRGALEACLHERALKSLPQAIAKQLVAGASLDFVALWPAIRDEADAEQDRAVKMLSARSKAEAQAMRTLLANQEKAIGAELGARRQTTLPLELDPRERAAYDADTRAMESRLGEIAAEREREPAKIEAQYQVALRRLSPVGLVYLWPAKDRRR